MQVAREALVWSVRSVPAAGAETPFEVRLRRSGGSILSSSYGYRSRMGAKLSLYHCTLVLLRTTVRSSICIVHTRLTASAREWVHSGEGAHKGVEEGASSRLSGRLSSCRGV